MAKTNITKGIWLLKATDKETNEVLQYVIASTSKQECRELIKEKEYERDLTFNHIIKFGNLAPTLYHELNPDWSGESMIILSNAPY